MRVFRLTGGLVAIALLAAWNALAARLGDRARAAPASPDAPDRARSDDPMLVEHERNWYDYIRGFHVHHAVDVACDCPEHGSFPAGLDLWLDARCLRGYTVGDHTYVCSNAPRVLRVHQAGHAPSFGGQFEPLRTERRDDGGLDDEPLRTLDVMLPGDFPHTLVRLRDPRGLCAAYDRWVRRGRIQRV